MPLMIKILNNVDNKTPQQKNLKARTIESIGIMITAVSENKNQFLQIVQEVTERLFNMLTS